MDQLGVLLVNYDSRFNVDYLEVISSSLKGLKINWKNIHSPLVIYAFNHPGESSVKAYYYPELRSIGVFIGSKKSYLNDKQKVAFRDVIMHELGHEYIFNFLSPNDLKKLANEVGGWTYEKKDFTSFYDVQFLIPFGKHQKNNSFFPSDYSFYNTHEWFCENFSKNISFLSQLGIRNIF